MAFVLSKKPTFLYTVKVKQARDSGKLDTFEFIAEYKRLNQREVQELLAKKLSNRELLDEVWIGWKSGVRQMVRQGETEVESDLEVTPVNKEALLLEPGVEVALAVGWLEAVVFGPTKN